MPIDLNIPPDQHGELLPDLNEEPAHEEDEIAHLQEDQLHEDEAQLPDQHGELLPDLNQKPAYEQEDKISHVQQDQVYAAEAHFQGQPLHLHHNERLGMHVIDLDATYLSVELGAADLDAEHEYTVGPSWLGDAPVPPT
ncbi:unnamed protein product [Miscanthus lutarioriparius]|uniref:Uncharacterized protein n=1 Tax=Miscanthus lutarioriparius TaxID=422564 RepID=A0A811RXB3_9POAL|nr:unnamed protein product [Miscanthus lutarioriparius]